LILDDWPASSILYPVSNIQPMKSSSIIKNTFSLITAHLFGRILSFVLIIMLPRYLEGGFDDLGRYFAALWLAILLGTITELGLYTPLVREVAADRSKAPKIISNVLVIRLILLCITFLIIVVLSRFMYSGDIAPLIYILGISEILNALTQLCRRVFRAFERMGFEALGIILERIIVFALGIGVLIRGYGIISFSIVVLTASVLNLVLTFSIMVWKFSRPSLRFLDVKLCGHLLKQALPFALAGALSTIYFRIDGLMLKHIMGPVGNTAAGWYGTAYNLVMVMTIIPGAFMGSVFPVMSRMLQSSAAAMDFLYTKSLKLMFIIALPIAVGVTFLADKMVSIIYSAERFAPQDQQALSQILEILIWAGALIFINFVLITVFRAANKRRAFSVMMAVSVSVNIGANLLLIPRYGHLGAAASMIISESVFFICGLWYIHRHVCKLNEVAFVVKSTFASGFLGLGLFVWKYAGYSESVSVALVICLAVIAYFAAILALKGITREDIDMVRGQFQGSVEIE